MTVLVLAGGVGGARFAHGLAQVLPAGEIAICVNTGDDFEHLGLPISPDLDTVTYTLAGKADEQRGWGLAAESWAFIDQIGQLGGPDWFLLGDRDLATHVLRRVHLDGGGTLTTFTDSLNRTLETGVDVFPMSDDAVRTIVETSMGDLSFQEYFVRERCIPEVRAVSFEGSTTARPNAKLLSYLDAGDLEAVIIAPSNPYLSIDPILALPGVRARIGELRCPVVAISPIVGGRAVKGPAAKIMSELGLQPSALTVANHYVGCIDCLVIDEADRPLRSAIAERVGACVVTDTIMSTPDKRRQLAAHVVQFMRRAGTSWEEEHGSVDLADHTVS